MINTEDIKTLRKETLISLNKCREALMSADGDIDKAREILREESKGMIQKKKDRDLGSGVVQSYIHSSNNVGAMVELLCETDFVARNEEFIKLAYDIALHCVAMNPRYTLNEASNNDNVLDEEILENQPFVKDPNMTIKNIIEGAIQKFGERIEVGEFHIIDAR